MNHQGLSFNYLENVMMQEQAKKMLFGFWHGVNVEEITGNMYVARGTSDQRENTPCLMCDLG